MHPHGMLQTMMLAHSPTGVPQQQQHQQNTSAGGGSSSEPNDLLASLNPCPLPDDMPLPVGSRKAAASAAAVTADDDDDSAGFDWQGLARPSRQQKPQQQQNKQQQRDAADAIAKASQRIAVITGSAPSPAAAATLGAPNTTQNVAAADPVPEGPQDGTDALGRRVWDKEYYEAKAREKALSSTDSFLDLLPRPREKPKPPPLPPCGYRQQLQPRNFKLDFEREVGKTKMVTLQTPRMQQGGFWCDICECLCKDSQAYLDHINGRNHNRILGMSMRVERVPLARVKAKLQAARRGLAAEADATEAAKADASVKILGYSEGTANDAEDEFDRVKRRIEELQREQELKKQRKKDKKKKAAAGCKPGTAANDDIANPDAAALAAMGLPTSFSGC